MACLSGEQKLCMKIIEVYNNILKFFYGFCWKNSLQFSKSFDIISSEQSPLCFTFALSAKVYACFLALPLSQKITCFAQDFSGALVDIYKKVWRLWYNRYNGQERIGYINEHLQIV